MVRIFEIDLDKERVFVHKEWLAVDELAARLKDKVERRDFSDLSLLSEALERLQAVLNDAKELKVRVTKEVAESYETIAKRSGQPVQSIMRAALNNYLTSKEANQYLIDPEAEAKLAALSSRIGDAQVEGKGLTSLADLESGSSAGGVPQEGKDKKKNDKKKSNKN
ncbi:MAG: hypothetical protein GXP49_11280 [Deltaproteobacteria bacterium]|nr:hypothetical protein [Deltaproteobacteria bacterium]